MTMTTHDIPCTPSNLQHWIKLINDNETFLIKLDQYQITQLAKFVISEIKESKREVSMVKVQGVEFKSIEEKIVWLGDEYLLSLFKVHKKLCTFQKTRSLNKRNAKIGGEGSKRTPDKAVDAIKKILQQKGITKIAPTTALNHAQIHDIRLEDGSPVSLSWCKKHFKLNSKSR